MLTFPTTAHLRLGIGASAFVTIGVALGDPILRRVGLDSAVATPLQTYFPAAILVLIQSVLLLTSLRKAPSAPWWALVPLASAQALLFCFYGLSVAFWPSLLLEAHSTRELALFGLFLLTLSSLLIQVLIAAACVQRGRQVGRGQRVLPHAQTPAGTPHGT